MKKVLAILLAGMMTATAFAGCGGSSSSSAGSGSKSSSSKSSSSKSSSNKSSSNKDSKDDTSSKSDDTDSKGDDNTNIETDIDPNWPDEKYFGDETNIELKVWAPDKAVSLTKDMVKAFQNHYSGIKFKNIEVVAQGESDAATMVMNDSKKAADVFGFPSDQLDKLKAADVLAPAAKVLVDPVRAYNAEKPVQAVMDGDKLYAYPETNDNGYYLVYDKTVVSDEDAKTLEGVLKACKAKNKQFILDTGNGFYSCMFAFTGGAVIDGFEDDGITQKFVDFDEDEVIDTIMAFAQLMKDYKGTYSSQDTAQISASLKNGKAAAGVDGTWNSQADKDALGNKFAAAKLPTINVKGTDKQIVSLFGYKYIGVNSSSKFPRAAQLLAYYLTGEECQTQRAQKLGWGPSNIKALDAVVDDPIIQAVSAQSANAVPQVEIAGTFWTPMGTLGSEIYKDSWKPGDRAATKTLWEKVLKNIKDE